MGVIKRQGIKNSLVNYLGVALGVVSALLIYPRAPEAYGLFRVMYDAAILLSPFILLGFQSVAVRYFPVFRDPEKDHNGFLFFLLGTAFFGFLFFLLLLPGIRWVLLEKLFVKDGKGDLLHQYFYYLLPLTFLLVYIKLFVQYISNFQRIVVPAIFEQLSIKLSLPLLILFYLREWITLNGLVGGVIANYLVALLGLVFYTWWLGELKLRPRFDFLNRALVRRISTYAFYGVLGLLGSQLAFRIDTLMVGGLEGYRSAGIYAIVGVLIEVIIKPARAIISIAGPIISKSWEANDLDEIRMIYQKSSLNLLIVGIFIFLGIWISLDALFSLMPNSEELKMARNVVLFLGIARLVDMGTSVNNEIISYSRYFRFNFYATLFLALFNIVFNLLFIPIYHMTGAAMATLASISLFNLVKFIFIRRKFDMQPFSLGTLQVLGIAAVAWGGTALLPDFANPLLEILVNSACLSVVFPGLILFFRVSPDLNDLLRQAIVRVTNLFK